MFHLVALLHSLIISATMSLSRCEALQCSDQHSGPSENVRLWHQWPPGGLRGQNNGCRLQALHGSKWGKKKSGEDTPGGVGKDSLEMY